MTDFDVKYDIIDIGTLTERDISDTLRLMSEQKRRRVENFPHSDDRLRSIAAEFLARRLISNHLSVPEHTVLITQPESGQPMVCGLPCFVSLSHSGHLAMAAIAHRPVGADIEVISNRGERLLRRVCSPSEQEYILASDSFDPARFFAVWTAKEAILKHSGRGLSGGLASTVVADAGGLLPSVNGLQLIPGTHDGAAFSICI